MKIIGIRAPSAAVKQVWLVLKSRGTDAMKTKVVVLGVIKNKNKKIFSKMKSVFRHQESQRKYIDITPDDDDEIISCTEVVEQIPHALLESETPCDKFPTNSVSAVTELGPRLSTCSMEDQIDSLAEDFIRRFRSQMILQKQNSFQRYRDMLDRSV